MGEDEALKLLLRRIIRIYILPKQKKCSKIQIPTLLVKGDNLMSTLDKAVQTQLNNIQMLCCKDNVN